MKGETHCEVCGCGGREEGAGKDDFLLLCPVGLILNFNVMAKDRAAFLQLLNSKIKNHMLRREESGKQKQLQDYKVF